MSEPSQTQLPRVFEALPLARWRAYLSLTFGGLALLLIGGVLSYASGSPDVHGSVSTYWTVFFAFYALAFGGAALLGAFPRLARWPIKLGWLAAVMSVLFAALIIRARALTAVGMTNAPPAAIGQYAVSLFPILMGLAFRGEQAMPADGSSAAGATHDGD